MAKLKLLRIAFLWLLVTIIIAINIDCCSAMETARSYSSFNEMTVRTASANLKLLVKVLPLLEKLQETDRHLENKLIEILDGKRHSLKQADALVLEHNQLVNEIDKLIQLKN